MALTGFKNTRSFGDYSKKPFKVIFVRGELKEGFVYVYRVSSDSFIEKPKGSHQWISKKDVKIIDVEKFSVSSLKDFWRKATEKEKLWYYKLEEDLEFARRTEEAYKRHERGEFKSLPVDKFLEELKARWFLS